MGLNDKPKRVAIKTLGFSKHVHWTMTASVEQIAQMRQTLATIVAELLPCSMSFYRPQARSSGNVNQ
eukprot:2796490-Amphidinium_carterae.1